MIFIDLYLSISFFIGIISGIVSLILTFMCSLRVHRYMINLCVLSLYPMTLLILCISSGNASVSSLGFST